MIHRSIGGAAQDVGACAGDDENSGASAEGAVEGDLFVSGEQEIAADGLADLALGPFADGLDAEAGEADAGLGDLAEGDACGERDLCQHGLQAGRGFGFADAHQFDAACGGSPEDLAFVCQEASCLGTACIDRQKETHQHT